jgi:hypothetical protein
MSVNKTHADRVWERWLMMVLPVGELANSSLSVVRAVLIFMKKY